MADPWRGDGNGVQPLEERYNIQNSKQQYFINMKWVLTLIFIKIIGEKLCVLNKKLVFSVFTMIIEVFNLSFL